MLSTLDTTSTRAALVLCSNISRAHDTAMRMWVKAHVCFVQGVTSHCIDLVLFNCVINLIPMEGKSALFKELGRVPKPGGMFENPARPSMFSSDTELHQEGRGQDPCLYNT
jgi:hypothetical protein